MNTRDALMALLRSEVCGDRIDAETKAGLTPQLLESVYTLAKGHDLAHIAGQALGKLGVLTDNETSNQFRRQSMLALMRHSQLDFEHENICATLTDAQIPFIPLKGAVLRAYYPEGWMRTSCDIDILVKEADLEAATTALTEKLGYRRGSKSHHDISLFSAGGVHLELHFTAVEEGRARNAQAILGRIWEDACPKEPGAFEHCLSDAMFYFYHIAHMAKHVEEGGCGIRSYLDLWILNNRVEYDRPAREALLAEGGLLTFAVAAQKLSEAWFSGSQPDELTCQLERFVLGGGMYGSVENNVAVKQSGKNSKLGYAMKRIFPPLEKMKLLYPVLERHKWLLPLFFVIRWVQIIFTGRTNQSLQELKLSISVSPETENAIADLLNKLDLI